jgi:hypothetical protein
LTALTKTLNRESGYYQFEATAATFQVATQMPRFEPRPATDSTPDSHLFDDYVN